MNPQEIVLGSRSPQRRELLSLLMPQARIVVDAPRSSTEASLVGLHDWPTIRTRLIEIAREKWTQVAQARKSFPASWLVTADTTVVVETTAPQMSAASTQQDWQRSTTLRALEQPDPENWRAEVAKWFTNYYAGRTHWTATAVCLGRSDAQPGSDVVTTAVSMRPDVASWLPWYLSTEESRGKAGGYAIQGAGSLFVTLVEGSLSNVVGLPIERLSEMFRDQLASGHSP